MLEILDTLRADPQRLALTDGENIFSARDLVTLVEDLAEYLVANNVRRAALLADNSPAWIIADLASQLADICLLPLPLFFTRQQIQHCIDTAGIRHILTNDTNLTKMKVDNLSDAWHIHCDTGVAINRLTAFPQRALPEATAKITFTSGTTGRPKGVCLSGQQLMAVSRAVVEATGITEPRHLCLLPLTTLLENIAGVYAPLLVSGQVVAPNLETVGLTGSSQLNAGRLLLAIERYQPTTLILIPQLLMALTTACEFGWQPPKSLQFIAVGGARVAANLLIKARQFGLPVYEGYGLSECGSVVALNTPARNQTGSCGRILPHVRVAVEDGELVVRGNTFLGYTGDQRNWYSDLVRTGDSGFIDDDGFIHINGRRKNILISSFGRNISPEWPEAELLAGPLLSQCLVFGDGKPYCGALLMPREPRIDNDTIQHWIDRVNSNLPDYAQIIVWLRLSDPFTVANGFLTENGRPRREEILSHYATAIESLYCIDEAAS